MQSTDYKSDVVTTCREIYSEPMFQYTLITDKLPTMQQYNVLFDKPNIPLE